MKQIPIYGTRVSECRQCRARLELRNWEWSEAP